MVFVSLTEWPTGGPPVNGLRYSSFSIRKPEQKKDLRGENPFNQVGTVLGKPTWSVFAMVMACHLDTYLDRLPSIQYAAHSSVHI